MALSTAILSGCRNAQAFWLGSALVTIGVVLHLPMFLMARHSGYVLAGMPMDPLMYWGMALIVGGIGFAAYGLLPKSLAAMSGDSGWLDMAPPEDAPLTPSHWGMAGLLAVALIIDINMPTGLLLVALSPLLPESARFRQQMGRGGEARAM